MRAHCTHKTGNAKLYYFKHKTNLKYVKNRFYEALITRFSFTKLNLFLNYEKGLTFYCPKKSNNAVITIFVTQIGVGSKSNIMSYKTNGLTELILLGSD